MGGIAVDGYAGKLTRNHPDVDMLVFRDDLGKVERVLTKLGYPYEIFEHPKELEFKYKLRSNDKDRIFSFQIIDELPNNKFEISFYRNPHLIFQLSYIKPPNWLVFEGVRFPAVSKEFLIKLKLNEVEFYEKLKFQNPEKYLNKWQFKHLNCLHDLDILKS